MTVVYVTDLPPLFNWAHSTLAALIILTVLQNCCLPFVHNCLYLLALALFILCVLVNIMSVQSYSTALIWEYPQCTLIFFYQAFMSLNSCYMARHLVFSRVRLFVTIMCAKLSHITVCLKRNKQTNKQKTKNKKTKLKGKIKIPAPTFN